MNKYYLLNFIAKLKSRMECFVIVKELIYFGAIWHSNFDFKIAITDKDHSYYYLKICHFINNLLDLNFIVGSDFYTTKNTIIAVKQAITKVIVVIAVIMAMGPAQVNKRTVDPY